MLFVGTYSVRIDDSGGLVLPKHHRAGLKGECTLVLDPDGHGALYARADPTLAVELQGRLRNAPRWEIIVGARARIVLPQRLRKEAGLEGTRAILLGVGERIEIWSEREWMIRVHTLGRPAVEAVASLL